MNDRGAGIPLQHWENPGIRKGRMPLARGLGCPQNLFFILFFQKAILIALRYTLTSDEMQYIHIYRAAAHIATQPVGATAKVAPLKHFLS